MSASQSFIMAAASDLAWRLVENPSGPQAPRVAETARGATDAPPPSSAQLEPLLALARQVVEAVVGLSGQKLDPEALGPILQRAAEKHLMIHPELRRAAEARLAGEIPRLINLPHLAELAGRGLDPGPQGGRRLRGHGPIGRLRPAHRGSGAGGRDRLPGAFDRRKRHR